MKLIKIVELAEKIKRELGDKDIKEVVVSEDCINVIFQDGFVLSVR